MLTADQKKFTIDGVEYLTLFGGLELPPSAPLLRVEPNPCRRQREGSPAIDGHSSIQTTLNIYAHLLDSDLVTSVNLLGRK